MRSRGAERLVLAAVLFCFALCASAEGVVSAQDLERRRDDGTREPSPVVLAEDVFDPIFAFFLAVLDHDQFGRVDAAFLDSLASAEGGSKVPYQSIATMGRDEVDGADAIVRIVLDGDLDVPIPFSILSYRPGSVRATERLDMIHWSMGDRGFMIGGEKADDAPDSITVEQGQLFVLAEGSMEMDIDGWLDRLLGGRLDDVQLRGFYVFRHEGKRIGLGFGHNPKGDGRTGAFDFSTNESIFPASRAYLGIGRQVRAIAEQRLERWRAGQRRAGGQPRSVAPR